ncbi:hypothetical protein PPYR_00715 [Photinus pyralis]|uniref:DDE Tnp4 domain-containing protein n=1 Tax=Photinus pyralis TaxID=7054 RepID=A0A5N4B2C8_PHOPY|nr:hypothetical protein PPYR_00715 [Photinus pyralis]
MENINCRILLCSIEALVIKMNRCYSVQKYSLQQQVIKLYKLYKLVQKYHKTNKRMWVRDVFKEEQRLLQGTSSNLIMEMRRTDRNKFFNFLRMAPETFDLLLSIVGPYVQKKLLIREPIPAKVRLEITLRYLASGDSMTSLSYNFRVGKQSVSRIIFETCNAIWEGLKNKVFYDPTDTYWKTIAQTFEEKWNFKHCIGAIDGKHVNIQALPKSGSAYYNYKGTHSINLLAIADADYKFIMVDIGAPGRMSDSGIFRDSRLGMGFEQTNFHLPPPEDNLPYVIVGDEAFPLTNYLMRPYPRRGDLDLRKKVFNYRLSRARRIVENAFGILVSKWRVFRKPIIASEDTVRKIVQACVCLHNFLLMQIAESQNYSRCEETNESVTTDGLSNITRTGTNTFSRRAAQYRELFADYFCNAVAEGIE